MYRRAGTLAAACRAAVGGRTRGAGPAGGSRAAKGRCLVRGETCTAHASPTRACPRECDRDAHSAHDGARHVLAPAAAGGCGAVPCWASGGAAAIAHAAAAGVGYCRAALHVRPETLAGRASAHGVRNPVRAPGGAVILVRSQAAGANVTRGGYPTSHGVRRTPKGIH